MSAKIESTADKILSATIDLMSEKGYKAVTVKEIAAAASVSEMTVFRTFGSKKAILDAVIDTYLFSAPIEQTIQNNITYELEADLMMISELYHNVLKKNKKLFLISVMERKTMPEMHLNLHQNASKFFEVVTEYMRMMQEKGKVRPGDPKTQALTLMRFNYGRYVSSILLEENAIAEDLQEVVAIIAKGLEI
ncbi:TetR/AcrR family transcriptional regulator [Paenibacillus sp. GCM10027626]|uniref:TetR/AcrR family transcriptional regulator n=1 Tax=Paenibacillus sp. GCM10027626 TaxID=3273411 RepID=UPI00362F5222